MLGLDEFGEQGQFAQSLGVIGEELCPCCQWYLPEVGDLGREDDRGHPILGLLDMQTSSERRE